MQSIRNIPVYLLLRENTHALDLIGPAEVFSYANRLTQAEDQTKLFDLHYISAESQIHTSIGLGLTGVTGLPVQLPHDAIIFLIGCFGHDDDFSSPSAQITVDWLKQMVQPKHRVLCICTGALLAAHAGLLDGHECTTHHQYYARLRDLAPKAKVLENRIFVEDGTMYTSAGVTAGIDLTLHLIAQISGYQFALAIAQNMVIYMRRTGTDPQLSPWLAHRNHIHPAIHRVQDAMVADPAQSWSMPQLAQIACSSERHLTRLFREHTGTGVIDFYIAYALVWRANY